MGQTVSAPKPSVFEAICDDLNAVTKKVFFDYGALHDLGYSRRGSQAETGSRQRHSTHTDLLDLFIEDSDISFVRDKLEEAAKSMETSKKHAQHTEVCLNDIVVRLDRRAHDDPEDTIERPDKGERTRLLAAKDRREGRSKGPLGSDEIAGVYGEAGRR